MQCIMCGISALFSPATNTMQLLMWRRNIVGVAHYIQDCFEVLGALDDASDDATISSSSALAAGYMQIVSAEALRVWRMHALPQVE